MRKLVLIAFLLGCNNHPIKAVELSPSSTPSDQFDLDLDKRVDILFVVDNSGSMAEEQADLASNFGPFIQGLDSAGIDYRIAVTTTDRGNIWCPETNSLKGGEFAQISCLDRPEDFLLVGNPNQDFFGSSCQAVCQSNTQELGLGLNSWIDKTTPNPVDAFQCLAPQGVTGCGFESTLESILHFVGEAKNKEFFRPEALFSIVILSDEEDCSFNPDWENSIFSSQGTKEFWSDPMSSFPTSAVCWNASISCEGDPLNCFSQNFDENGDITTDLTKAVIYPMSRYYGMLDSFQKSSISIIAGVQLDGSVSYSQEDPSSLNRYGVDPGCLGEEGQIAIPPVRLLEVADSRFSICSGDYSDVVTNIVNSIIEDIPPACFEACVLDQDEETPEIDAYCQVIQNGVERESLLECDSGPTLPEGEEACWYVLSGDEMNPECLVPGQNVEFRLLRAEGVEVDPQATISVSCEVSAFPSLDCP